MKNLVLILLLFLFVQTGFGQNLQISGGNTFSVALCDNGLVYAWGRNNTGQFGLDATGTPYGLASSATPQPVYFHTGGGTTGGLAHMMAKQVDAGSGSHAIALACDDFVYVWGESTCQQNGQGGTIPNNCECATTPDAYARRVKCGAVTGANCSGGYLTGVKYVSGANNASFAVLNNGDVVAWGENSFGQLGDGSTNDRSAPVYVMKSATQRLTNIVQIEGGDRCTYALDANGNVWSWGLNGGNELGRPTPGGQTSQNSPCGTTATNYAVYAGQVVNQAGTPISGITQISGGDTHGLALSGSGEIWSWGGDWGVGQLGQGTGYQANSYASRVNAPGTATPNTGPYVNNAVFIAAGQASSAAVLSNGNVITWGGNGFFNGCTGAGISMTSGVLGAGGVADGTCRTAGTADGSSEIPVYVMINGTTRLSGIKTISDGDAWYFASGPGGIYGWGWNQTGELGVTGNANQPYAKLINQPPCQFGAACPSKPNLGPDRQTCPVFSELLNAGSVESSYKFTWEFSATGTFPAVTGGTPAGTDYTTGSPTYTVYDPLVGAATSNQFTATETTKGWGYYRVVIDDNRSYGPGNCGPCPVVGDTIRITEKPSPYTVQACQDATAQMAKFDVLAPTTSKIKWYTNPTGGTALNPSDSLRTITVPFSKTNTSFPSCQRALFAEDVATYQGTLRPTTTVTGPGCAAGTTQEQGSRSPLMIEVSNTLTLTSVDFIYPSFGFNTSKNYQVKIYANNPTGGSNTCTGCTGNKDGKGALLYTSATLNVVRNSGNPAELISIPTNYKLTGSSTAPVKYWIEISGDEVTYFGSGSCATPATVSGTPYWTTSEVDNSGYSVLKALTAMHDNDYKGKSHVLNLDFYTGTGYACGRIMVCVSSNCVLPVEFISFDVTRTGFSAILNWATSSERNSAYYVIEKSQDGEHFAPIGKVNASGNSSTVSDYTYTDASLAKGVTYYRLAQYDIDGTVHYSQVISLSREGIETVKVVPNPNNGSFNVIIPGAGEKATVTLNLKNSLGQVVYVSESASNTTHINIQHLPSGIYYLEVITDEGSMITKLVKE